MKGAASLFNLKLYTAENTFMLLKMLFKATGDVPEREREGGRDIEKKMYGYKSRDLEREPEKVIQKEYWI